MSTPPIRVRTAAASDTGQVRDNNQDSYLVGTTVFAVADGMGGHAGGEVASSEALEPIAALDAREFATAAEATEALRDAILEANARVVAHGEEHPELAGMGTTLTAGLLREGRLHLAHVGDSRAYLLHADGDLLQLTTDHNLVEQMVQDGRISRDQAAKHPQRNVITRAIGVEREVQVDTLEPIALRPGDQVLLCSDGLTGPVDDEVIRARLTAGEADEATVSQLVRAANEAGGPDNITAVLLRVEGAEDHGDGATPAAAAGAAGADEAHGARAGAGDGAPGPTHEISTAPGSLDSSDWAAQFGRLGEQQGARRGSVGDPKSPRGRGRLGRLTAGLLGLVLLVGLIGGGGYALVARAYFLGVDDDGLVTIYNGIPQEIAGVPLHWEVEGTDLVADELPSYRQSRLEDGLAVNNLNQAHSTVRSWSEDLEAEADDDNDTDDDNDADDDRDGD